MAELFRHDSTDYQIGEEIHETYIRDTSYYLHKMTDKPIESCIEFVKSNAMSDGPLGFKNPTVTCIARDENNDKFIKKTKLSNYFKECHSKNYILMPSLTAYASPEEEESVLSRYTQEKINARDLEKKEAKKAESEERWADATWWMNKQNTSKTLNNSISGATVSNGNPLCNKSAHSAMTSTCRISASTSNTSVERFLYGFRLYHTADIALQNIVNILSNANLDDYKSVMDKFNLHYVTHDECKDVIRMSTKVYSVPEEMLATTFAFIDKLSPLELSIYVYNQDMHNLLRYNDAFVRRLLDGLIKVDLTHPVDNPDFYFSMLNDDLTFMMNVILNKELDGLFFSNPDIRKREDYPNLMGALKQRIDILNEYSDFIRVFWINENIPPELAYFKDAIRYGVLGGDTDSTLFTVENWVKLYTGSLKTTPEALSTASAIIYLMSQMTAHSLAIASGRMNIPNKYKFMIQMKNEFLFPVFIVTNASKHYCAFRAVKEGVVFKKYQEEIKGVGLRNSTAPVIVMSKLKEFMTDLMMKYDKWEEFNLRDYIYRVAILEEFIRRETLKGNSEYLPTCQVRDKAAYKLDSSPYRYYELWQEIFADKYGNAPPIPYDAVRVSLNIPNKTVFAEWLTTINPEIAARIKYSLEARKMDKLTSFILPDATIRESGLPEELLSIVDVRNIISVLTTPFYLILESCGFYYKNKKATRLAMDLYPNLKNLDIDFDKELSFKI